MTIRNTSEDKYNGGVSRDKYIDLLEKEIILVCHGYGCGYISYVMELVCSNDEEWWQWWVIDQKMNTMAVSPER